MIPRSAISLGGVSSFNCAFISSNCPINVAHIPTVAIVGASSCFSISSSFLSAALHSEHLLQVLQSADGAAAPEFDEGPAQKKQVQFPLQVHFSFDFPFMDNGEVNGCDNVVDCESVLLGCNIWNGFEDVVVVKLGMFNGSRCDIELGNEGLGG